MDLPTNAPMNPSTDDGAPPWAAALLQQVERLAARVTELEQARAGTAALTRTGTPTEAGALAHAGAPAGATLPPADAASAQPARPEVTEEDMVYIAAAVAAYLGVRARIRQVRLVQSAAWAQVGRATIHASHRVH